VHKHEQSFSSIAGRQQTELQDTKIIQLKDKRFQVITKIVDAQSDCFYYLESFGLVVLRLQAKGKNKKLVPIFLSDRSQLFLKALVVEKIRVARIEGEHVFFKDDKVLSAGMMREFLDEGFEKEEGLATIALPLGPQNLQGLGYSKKLNVPFLQIVSDSIGGPVEMPTPHNQILHHLSVFQLEKLSLDSLMPEDLVFDYHEVFAAVLVVVDWNLEPKHLQSPLENSKGQFPIPHLPSQIRPDKVPLHYIIQLMEINLRRESVVLESRPGPPSHQLAILL
jgi:hypothetical protein